MRRRAFSLLAGGLLVAGPSRARAQARDVAIIGVLLAGTTTNYYSIDQLRAVLRESGFTDGENVTLQIRAADGHYERLPALANELVAMPARVIVAFACRRPWRQRQPPRRSPSSSPAAPTRLRSASSPASAGPAVT
jgi:hypothetical protein